jgi:hypothetical protein
MGVFDPLCERCERIRQTAGDLDRLPPSLCASIKTPVGDVRDVLADATVEVP